MILSLLPCQLGSDFYFLTFVVYVVYMYLCPHQWFVASSAIVNDEVN